MHVRLPGRTGQAIIGDLLQCAGLAQPVLRSIAAILPVLCCTSAHAQTSGSIALVSDYRFRGVSLSDGHPALQATLQYDSAGDWYAGAFASRVSLEDNDARIQLMGYGGYSYRLSSAWSWEAGAAASVFPGAGGYNYADAFLGLAVGNFSGRLHASPNYFGQGPTAYYLEVDGSCPLLTGLRLFGHAGWQHVAGSGGDDNIAARRNRWDARAGIAASAGRWNYQLAFAAVQDYRRTALVRGDSYRYGNGKGGAYVPGDRETSPRTVIFTATYSF